MVDETVLDEGKMAEAVELWHSFYEDACKEMKLPNRKSDRIQLGTWLRGRYLSEDVIVGVSTPKPKVITAEQRADMDAQGATELWHLGYTELSLATGRAVAKEETEKYAHKAPWTVMVGGALSIKHKHISLDDLIAAAELSGDMSAIDEHMNALSQSLRADKGNSFAQQLASNVLGWGQEARSQLKSPALIIHYYKRYRKYYKGRALPQA